MLHTAGQLAWSFTGLCGQSYTLKSLHGAISPRLASHARNLKTKSSIFKHVAMGEERERLKNHRHLMTTQLRELLCRHRVQRTALDSHLPLAGGDQTIQHPQQGGFT